MRPAPQLCTAVLAASRTALVAALLSTLPTPLRAQMVFQLQGGASSLYNGYGGVTNFWGPGYDGWIGAGYLGGPRVGAFLRTSLRRDTLRFGNDAIQMQLPTDVVGSAYNLLVQGVSATRVRGSMKATLFAGASATGGGSPFFPVRGEQKPLGGLFFSSRSVDSVSFYSALLLGRQQTWLQSVRWLPGGGTAAAVSYGIGAGHPYTAYSLTWLRNWVDFKSLLVLTPRRFRRTDAAMPLQAEPDRDNFSVRFTPGDNFGFGMSRQHFVQDSSDASTPLRAVGTSIFAGGRVLDTRFNVGVYMGSSRGVSNVSSYLSTARPINSWLDGEFFLLSSDPSNSARTTIPLLNLRERVSPRLRLLQQMSYAGGRGRVSLGGSIVSSYGDVGIDYQIYQLPFRTNNPFRTTLALTARLQLGKYSTNVSTVLDPYGRLNYSASGGTFLYRGIGGVQPQIISARMDRFVIRGRVIGVDSLPVDGAALAVGDEMAFTNSKGEFFVRRNRARAVPLRVSLDDFLLPGYWEVVSAPASVTAEAEDSAQPIAIVLRRIATPRAPQSSDSLSLQRLRQNTVPQNQQVRPPAMR